MKLCFLTSKTHQTWQVFMLPGAQRKGTFLTTPTTSRCLLPEIQTQLPGSAPSCQPPTGATGLPAELLLFCKPQNSSSRLLSAGGRRGRALFPFLTFILTRFAEEKKAVLNTRFSTVLSPDKHFPTPLERGKPHTKEPTSCKAQAGRAGWRPRGHGREDPTASLPPTRPRGDWGARAPSPGPQNRHGREGTGRGGPGPSDPSPA